MLKPMLNLQQPSDVKGCLPEATRFHLLIDNSFTALDNLVLAS